MALPWSLWAADFPSCTAAVDALQQGQVLRARQAFGIYVSESLTQPDLDPDPRCGPSLVDALNRAFIAHLTQTNLEQCRQLLTDPQGASPLALAQYNEQTARLAAYNGTLPLSVVQCQRDLNARYQGLDWLARHRPKLQSVLSQCLEAEVLLDEPVSLIDLEQAGGLIRTQWIAFWVEQARLDDGPMTEAVSDLFQHALLLAEACLMRAEQQWIQASHQ